MVLATCDVRRWPRSSAIRTRQASVLMLLSMAAWPRIMDTDVAMRVTARRCDGEESWRRHG